MIVHFRSTFGARTSLPISLYRFLESRLFVHCPPLWFSAHVLYSSINKRSVQTFVGFEPHTFCAFVITSGLVKANLFDILSRSKGVTKSYSSGMPDE